MSSSINQYSESSPQPSMASKVKGNVKGIFNRITELPDKKPKLRVVFDIAIIAAAIIGIVAMILIVGVSGPMAFGLVPLIAIAGLGGSMLLTDLTSGHPRLQRAAHIIAAVCLPIIVAGTAAALITVGVLGAGAPALFLAHPAFIAGILVAGLTLSALKLSVTKLHEINEIYRSRRANANAVRHQDSGYSSDSSTTRRNSITANMESAEEMHKKANQTTKMAAERRRAQRRARRAQNADSTQHVISSDSSTDSGGSVFNSNNAHKPRPERTIHKISSSSSSDSGKTAKERFHELSPAQQAKVRARMAARKSAAAEKNNPRPSSHSEEEQRKKQLKRERFNNLTPSQQAQVLARTRARRKAKRDAIKMPKLEVGLTSESEDSDKSSND